MSGSRKFSKRKRSSHSQKNLNDTDKLSQGRFVIGLHSCKEALKVRPKEILSIWLQKNKEDLDFFKSWALKHQVSVEERTNSFFDKMGSGHQGVGVLVKAQPVLDWEALEVQEQSLIVVLDGWEDPHNVGALLRTAWLTGVTGVLLPEKRQVPLTPVVHKVASGGVEHVPVEFCHIGQALERLKKQGFWVYGLSEKSEKSLWRVDLPEKVVWVIGAEGRGLRTSVEKQCDELLKLPQKSSEASFNASVSGALALFETQRQWQKES